MSGPEFQEWPKTPRLRRTVTITEKIDGTNACIIIEPGRPDDHPDGWCSGVYTDYGFFKVGAQSRKRIIEPGRDNYGFARWVQDNAETLVHDLGEGYHYGEWWGRGIQRGYGLDHKRFSLFNTHRWGGVEFETPSLDTVPHLATAEFSDRLVDTALSDLEMNGSYAALGQSAEGVVIYHHDSRKCFKVLIENDNQPKTIANRETRTTERSVA